MERPTASSTAIMVSTEFIFQIVHISISSFLLSPLDELSLSLSSTSYQSQLHDTITLFLLQSFYTEISSITASTSTINQLFTSTNYSSFSTSARKIRPRDIPTFTSESIKTNQESYHHERNQKILSILAKRNPQVYSIIENTVVLLLEEQGKNIITFQFCNSIIQQNIGLLFSLIQAMYKAVKQESLIHAVDSASQLTTSIYSEPEMVKLQSSTESILMEKGLKTIQRMILEIMNASFTQPCYSRISIIIII